MGLERLDVHVGDDLTGGDEIAFIHQFVLDAACQLRGNVDLCRLDAPVAAGESLRQLLGLQGLPYEVGQGRDDQQRRDQ